MHCWSILLLDREPTTPTTSCTTWTVSRISTDYGENRSYRLYDLADSYTKSSLFAGSNGKLKNSTKGIYYGIVSDDNAASTPVANPFDTMSGMVGYGGTCWYFVLTRVPKQ